MLLRPLIPASCLLLVSGGSEPEDDTGKPADWTGEDPNLKKEIADDEDATTGVEKQLLLDAIVAGEIVAMLVEFPVALMPLLVAADDELDIF